MQWRAAWAITIALGLGCGDDGASASTEATGSTTANTSASTTEGLDDGSGTDATEPPPTDDGWLYSDRQFIRDSRGRVVILRGVNARVDGVFDVTFDDGRLPLEDLATFTADDAQQMRALGFNVLRLPINWSGIEPTQGQYDEAYLDRVAAVVERCAAEEIWVILDYHQDAYSKEIGEDGAPLWAIQPPPTELLGGPLGDSLEMRRFSAQVLAAFAGFFNDQDEDLSDEWLQAAFGDMTRHVAERFADEPWVLGYELYNEPVASDAQVWAFHGRVVPKIREVDDRHLLLFEPSATRNVIETAPLSASAFADDQGIYAPHLYTFSFGDATTSLETLSEDDLRPNVQAAMAEAASWETPLFVGEWGIDPDATNSALYVELMYGLFDANLLHSTVWLWKEDSQGMWGLFDYDAASDTWTLRTDIAALHSRPYAMAIAGEPESMHYDLATQVLELRLTVGADADADTPTIVYVPEQFPESLSVRCDDTEVATVADRDPERGTIEVVCSGEGAHVIELRPS